MSCASIYVENSPSLEIEMQLYDEPSPARPNGPHSPRCSRSCLRCFAYCRHWTCTRPGSPWSWWQRAPCHCKNRKGEKASLQTNSLHDPLPRQGVTWKGKKLHSTDLLLKLLYFNTTCSLLSVMNYKQNKTTILSVLVAISLPAWLPTVCQPYCYTDTIFPGIKDAPWFRKLLYLQEIWIVIKTNMFTS